MEAGCALVRDAEALRAAFAYHPPYYHFEERATNYVDYGPQNSRGFKALKVWLALQHAGADGYRRMISEDIALSRAMADMVRQSDELEFFTQGLSITTFRYVPPALRPTVGEDRTFSRPFQRHPGCDCIMLPQTVANPDAVWNKVNPSQITDLTRKQRDALEGGANLHSTINDYQRKRGDYSGFLPPTRVDRVIDRAGQRDKAMDALRAIGVVL